MPSDESMIGPGAHEQVAHSDAMEGDNATAMVYAVLALASAVNRLADAQRDLVNIEMDRAYPSPRKRLYRPLAMRRVLLDSNALDPLTVPGSYEALEDAVSSARLEVFFTHVTVDEIAATPDLEKRQWLLNLLVFLGRPIHTSIMVCDVSRLNFCRLSDDDGVFEPLRSGNIKHSRDAVIAHTALTEGCVLVTNEKRLAARARDHGAEVLTTVDLLAEFGFLFPASAAIE